MTGRARATRDRTVLLLMAELGKPEPDEERLLILRAEALEALVDPTLDRRCRVCLESLAGLAPCGHCGHW